MTSARPRLARLLTGALAGMFIAVVHTPPAAAEPTGPPAPPQVRDVAAVSYLGRPVVDKAGNVTLPQSRLRSSGSTQKSYLDPTTIAAVTPARTPPTEPGGPEVDACLRSDGAKTPAGRVHNRFLWCQRSQLIAVRGTVGTGGTGGTKLSEMTMNYTAVAYGRDDKRRNITVFFKADSVSIVPPKGFIRGNSVLYQRIDCTGDASAPRPSSADGCGSTGAYVAMPIDDWDDGWTRWTIESDASVSQIPDKVLRHQWQFRGYVVDSFNKRLPDASGEKHTMRCDSATIAFAAYRSAACIHDDVVPHLQYSVNDSKVAEVAEHLRCAQDPTCITYPFPGTAKAIPGKYVGGQSESGALHRVRSAKTTSPIADANRAVVRPACGRLPIDVYDTAKGQECDEYPFASTMEGAACCDPPAFDWDFSIRGVDKTMNRCAGNALKKYYRDDRILYQQDAFFVEITDAPPTGPEYCDALLPEEDEQETDDGGGGDPEPDLPPTVNAGPDVSGNEGAAVLLLGSASDPETGRPDTRWTYRPVSGVDAGAECYFAWTNDPRTTVTCTDDGVYEVTLTAYDGVHTVSDSAQVTVSNVAPTFGTPGLRIAADPPEGIGLLSPTPWQVFRKGDEVTVNAAFAEPGANDTHTCVTTWDDGSSSTYTSEDLACHATHRFDRAGMFTIGTTVTDDDSGAGLGSVMVIVYDPWGGWANVDGSYDSPAGALPGAPTAAGEGWLHLAGKYYPQNDLNRPLGTARNWLPGNPYRFDSAGSTLDWLVVTPDNKIAAKGTGTVSGRSGTYGYVLYAYDGPDKVRMVVWPLSAGAYPQGEVVYDNRSAAGYDVDIAEPTTMRSGQALIQRP
ncbi:deoxyribonuclease NucA/NucB [Asanoa ferruginea]|uniref:Deoxyribonuclease NucA/NucB n=1 Tax=Asanoa ferruginea TaxID=53367 RepID=A0A3D9ZV11_9ACTN|nr:hypothetical protein [Asanoa ferruginea]REG01177.1 deoxyribonuclease NucA/NucB [Asanoa ferruginea]GIF47117.1 hypothetical protein Afe04nite_16560 [Asanoa ferruginea]